MNPSLRIATFIVILLFSAIATTRAGDQDSTYRVIGLFEPSRVEDLRETVKTMPDLQLMHVDYDTSEATFRYDAAKLIPGYDPKKPAADDAVAKRLDQLLRAASHGSFTLKPSAAIPKDKLESIAVKVGILDCRGCRYGVYLAVANLDGVERATVSADSLLTTWIDPAKTNREAIEAALKKARIEFSIP